MEKKMSKEQIIVCNAAIHTASAAAAAVGGGLAQIPGSDSVPIVTIQTIMVVSLAKVFGGDLSSLGWLIVGELCEGRL